MDYSKFFDEDLNILIDISYTLVQNPKYSDYCYDFEEFIKYIFKNNKKLKSIFYELFYVIAELDEYFFIEQGFKELIEKEECNKSKAIKKFLEDLKQ